MNTFDNIEDKLENYIDLILPQVKIYLRNHSSQYQDIVKQMEELEKNEDLYNLLYKRESVFLSKENHEAFLDYVDLEISARFLEYAVMYLCGTLDRDILEQIKEDIQSIIKT